MGSFLSVSRILDFRFQVWHQKSSVRGAGVSDKVAEMAGKCSIRTSLCQISSDRNPKFPPTGGLGASDSGDVAPSSPPLVPPLSGF